MAEFVSVESRLLRFYRGGAPDGSGRMIGDIWAFDLRRLEMVHDYIQWLFPIPELSRFNPDAPVLTPGDAAVFRRDPTLRTRLHRSLDMMLSFYGLAAGREEIRRGPAFTARAKDWLTPTNHNYLRLTRILLCLHHCGFDQDAHALLSCLNDISGQEGRAVIAPRTLDFWRAAVEVAPL